MNFFLRNVLMLHILLLVIGFSWIHGGTRPDLLMPVIPWLTVFVIEHLLVFPQAKSSETLVEARRRVWRSLVRDPLLYIGLLLTVLLVVPFFNVAGEPQFNVQTQEWRIPSPPYPGLPFCVTPDEHAVLLLWYVPALIAVLAARHGLLKRGKRLLLHALCWNATALALLGFAQLATGATSVYWGAATFSYFFSTFGYPNFAGAFFTLHFALATGLWFSRASGERFGPAAAGVAWTEDDNASSPHWLLIPVLLNLVAAIASLSRAAILLCGVVFLVLSVYMLVGIWQKSDAGGHVKLVGVVLGVLLLVGLAFTIFAPGALKAELTTITPSAVFERVSGRGQYHARVAREIFMEHRLFGVGGWGYPHFATVTMTPEERKTMQIQGGANVHNDTLQFLAEQGAVGFGLMVLCALMLIVPLMVQAVRTTRVLASAGLNATPAKPVWLYCLPPEVVAVFVGTTATVCHSLGDLPFRSPAILTVWLLAFACADGFLPAVRSSKARTSGE